MNDDKHTLRLEEVKDAVEKEWERKTTLENKGTALVQIAGTATAIIFGFVTFTQSVQDYFFPTHMQVFVSISVGLGIVSMILCVIVLGLRRYQFPFEETYI